MTLYIVAGSTQEYERWAVAYSQRIHEGSAPEEPVRLLQNAQQINLLTEHDEVLLLRHWQTRSDWRAIYNRLIARGRAAGGRT